MADDFRGYDIWKSTDTDDDWREPMYIHMCLRGHVRLTNLPKVCWQCIAEDAKKGKNNDD